MLEESNFRAGCPLYSFIVDRQPEFQILRLFQTPRMRILLIKQDEISRREEELNDLDRGEKSRGILGAVVRI